MNHEIDMLMDKLDNLTADYEQLKSRIFYMMDQAIRDAFVAKDRTEKMEHMGKYKVLDKLMREAYLYKDYINEEVEGD